MNIRVRVHHVNNFRMDEPVTFAPAHYTPVADILVESPMSSILDEAYGRSQHLYDTPWFAADGITKLVEHTNVRSTSVGDILEVLVGERATCGAIHVVKAIGFERIDPLTVLDWKRVREAA